MIYSLTGKEIVENIKNDTILLNSLYDLEIASMSDPNLLLLARKIEENIDIINQIIDNTITKIKYTDKLEKDINLYISGEVQKQKILEEMKNYYMELAIEWEENRISDLNLIETINKYSISKKIIENIFLSESLEDILIAFSWNELPEAQRDILRNLSYRFAYVVKYRYVDNFFLENWDKFVGGWNADIINSKPKVKLLIEAITSEFDKLCQILESIKDVMNIDKAPEEMLDYIAGTLGFERTDNKMNTSSFREILKNILDIYTIKGTTYAFELFFRFLGFYCYVDEYFFDRRKIFEAKINNETYVTNKFDFRKYLTSKYPPYEIVNLLNTFGEVFLCQEIEIQPTLDLETFEFFATRQENLDSVYTMLGYYIDYEQLNSKGFPKVYNIEDLDIERLKPGTWHLPTENEVIRQRLGWYKTRHGDKIDLLTNMTADYYKYFRTNYCKYSIVPFKIDVTEEDVDLVKSYLGFLTPSYIRSDVIAKPAELISKIIMIKSFIQQKIKYNLSTKIENIYDYYNAWHRLNPKSELCDYGENRMQFNHEWGYGFPERPYSDDLIINMRNYPYNLYDRENNSNKYKATREGYFIPDYIKQVYPDSYLIEKKDRLQYNHFYKIDTNKLKEYIWGKYWTVDPISGDVLEVVRFE